MAEQMDFSTSDESISELNSANETEDQRSANCFLGDECENVEAEDSLLDKTYQTMELDVACDTTSKLQEMEFDYSETLHEIENQIAEEIARSYADAVLNRLDHLDDRCMECSETLNEFFQHVFNEFNVARVLRNWNRVGELQEIFEKSEPFYKPVLLMIKLIDKIKKDVRKLGDRLPKRIAKKMILTGNTLEDILDELMSTVPQI